MSGLIVKQKLSYCLTGTSLTIPFSLLGCQSDVIQYIGICLKASANHRLRIRDISGNIIQEKEHEGSPNYEICVLGGNLNLGFPNIYLFEAESTEPISIFELNLATLCFCS